MCHGFRVLPAMQQNKRPNLVSLTTINPDGSHYVLNPLSPLSDPSNGAPKRPTPKANS